MYNLLNIVTTNLINRTNKLSSRFVKIFINKYDNLKSYVIKSKIHLAPGVHKDAVDASSLFVV